MEQTQERCEPHSQWNIDTNVPPTDGTSQQMSAHSVDSKATVNKKSFDENPYLSASLLLPVCNSKDPLNAGNV